MAYLIAILIALVLFFGFIALTALERRRGARLFGKARVLLDAKASAAGAVLTSADPLDFLVRGVRVIAGHVFHDLANVAWAFVRLLERTLALTVRRLRVMRHEERTETNSSFVKSISFHKRTLRTPETPAETAPTAEAENTPG